MASVLAAVLIALLCGQCESSTKALCMKTIALLPLPTAIPANAPANNFEKDTTYRTTGPSTKNTSRTSSKDLGNTSRKKSDSSTVENMAKKPNDLTTTHVYSTSTSTMYVCTDQTRELIRMNQRLCKIYGLTASQQSVSLTTTPPLTQHDMCLKKSQAFRLPIITCDATNMASLTGCNLNTSQCHSNPA